MGINKLNLKIIAATSMCIFSLFALFSGTIAWFNVTQAATDNANNMGVGNTGNMFESLSFHPVVKIDVDEDSNPTTMYFDKGVSLSTVTDAQLQAGTASVSFTMDHYTLLRTRNPVLALIKLKNAYTVSADCSVKVSMILDDASEYIGSKTAAEVQAMATAGTLPLSSVVKFSVGYLTGSSTEAHDSADSIDSITKTVSMAYSIDSSKTSAAQYAFDAPASYSSYVTFTDGTPQFGAKDAFEDAFVGAEGQVVRYVYFIFDYDEESLDYIYNKFLGQSFLEDDLEFNCDWSLLI